MTRYPAAWGAFAELAPEIEIVDFSYVQDKGSWVIVDATGGKHFFRIFRDEIVGLISPLATVIFQHGETIFCGK
jgi:hypothetical protein